ATSRCRCPEFLAVGDEHAPREVSGLTAVDPVTQTCLHVGDVVIADDTLEVGSALFGLLEDALVMLRQHLSFIPELDVGKAETGQLITVVPRRRHRLELDPSEDRLELFW